jgi:hypothetical protein
VLGGAGVSVAGVSRTHGNLRIGLTPLVQLAESGAAAAMLSPCRPVAAVGDQAQIGESCRNPSPGLARAAAGAGLAGGYAGLYLYFHHAWWSGTPAPKWFIQNDWDQAERDADKFGHLFGGYHLTRVTSELLQAGCVGKSSAVEAAVLYAYAFQFQIEEWDGTQQLYGFSPADLIADAGGALLASVQIRNGDLRYIKPVWSYRPTAAFRRRNLAGHNGQPRATTDYAGQVYWLSTDVHDALPESVKRFWPALLRVSPGYSITDYIDPVTGQPLRAKRRLLLSLDLEPEALPGDNRVWKVVKHELSFLRVPGPTLQLTPKGAYLGFYY